MNSDEGPIVGCWGTLTSAIHGVDPGEADIDRRLDGLREDNVALQAKLDAAVAILGAM